MKRTRVDRGRRTAVALCSLLSLALVLSGLGGGMVAEASWSARLTATGVVGAGSVAVSVGALPPIAFTNSSMTATAAVTVSNTTTGVSPFPAAVETEFTTSSTDQLVSSTRALAWPVSAATECTNTAIPNGDAVQGTWAGGVTVNTAALAPGDSQVICIRSSIDSRQDAAAVSGARTADVSVEARLSLHAFAATAEAASAISTSQIYPFATLGNFWYNINPSGQSGCFDVTGGVNTAPGALLGTFPCHGDLDPSFSNQWFTLTPFGGSIVGIRSAGPANRFAQPNTTGGVAMQLRDTAEPAQGWEPQLVAPGLFQFVNDASGLCLTAGVSSSPLSTQECNGSALQSFSATQLPVAAPTDTGDGT